MFESIVFNSECTEEGGGGRAEVERGGEGGGGGRACISDCHYQDFFKIFYYYSKV